MDFLIEPLFYNWLILAAILLIIEVASFTLLFFWLSIAAIIMAGVSAVMPDLSIATQLTIFSVIAILAGIIWGKMFRKGQADMGDKRMNNRADRYIGRTATLVEPIENGYGKIQIEDSFWRVRCDQALANGSQVEIVDTDGVLLSVVAK